MASSSNPKPRQPRLRASCDGCFLAKVKCSKTRPMCSRCLTCGIECRYSPSSRIGKPRTDQGGAPQAAAAAAASSSSSSSSLSPSSSQYLQHQQQQHHHHHQLHNQHHHHHQKHELDLSCLSPLVDASCGSGGGGGDFVMFSPISPLSPVTPDLMMGAGDATGWASSSSPIAVVDRNHQAAMAMLGMDGSGGGGVGGIMGEVGADFYAAWTRPSDMTAVGADSPLSNTTTTTSSPIHPAVPLHRGLSMDSIMAASAGGLVTSSSPPPPLPAWTDAVADMMGGYHPAAAGHGCYFASSPSAGSPDPGPVLTPTPTQAQAPALIHSRTASSPPHQQGILCPSSSSSSCVCFGACLQLLQTLHEIVSPPVELVLRLSAKAIEGCTSMLACPKCLGHQDRGTAAMMLAAVIVKLTKFYHDAAVDPSGCHGDSAAGTGLGIVTNSGGGGWPELDFLAREMARLQDLFRQFNDACGGSSSMPEVAATALPGGMDIGRSVAELVGQNLSVNMAAVTHKMRSSNHRLQQVHYPNHNHHGHARGGSSGYGGAGRLGRE